MKVLAQPYYYYGRAC